MAFKKIERKRFGSERLVNTVNIAVSKTGQATITVSGDIFKQIGEPLYAKIMVGNGKHDGLIAIVPRAIPGNGSTKILAASPSAVARKICVPAHLVGLPRDYRKTNIVPHQITDDGLIVDFRSIISPAIREAAE